MKKTLILNGLSGNLKSSLACYLEKEKGYINISSNTKLYYHLLRECLPEGYYVPNELTAVNKLLQLINTSTTLDRVVFDKTSIESLFFNRASRDKLLNPDLSFLKDYQLSDYEISKFLELEIQYFSKHENVSRVLMITDDRDFVDQLMLMDDDRKWTFGSTDNYYRVQDKFISFYQKFITTPYQIKKITNIKEVTLDKLYNNFYE